MTPSETTGPDEARTRTPASDPATRPAAEDCAASAATGAVASAAEGARTTDGREGKAGKWSPRVRRKGLISQFLGIQTLANIPLSILILFAGLTLILMVSLPALVSVRQNESTLTRLLAEKGGALIAACETILRSGMRGQAGVRLQMLLEEMGTGHDISFIAVTMPDGTIVAHSRRERVGELLTIEGHEASEQAMRMLAPKGSVHWGVMQMEGTRAFVVYRQFFPERVPPRRAMHARPLPVPMIFLGMDISPFESTRSQNRAYVTMLVGATFTVGLAMLAALYFAQRARQSRSRQKVAEGRVRVLEEEMRRKEKLAAVGNLAAGVAHEIRNPLSSIKGFATYFMQKFPEGSEDRKAAGVMVHEVERLNRVITDLISLSRPTDVRLTPTAPDRVIDHVTRLLSQDAGNRGVRIRIVLPRKVPLVTADPDRLGQALLNLCLNALEAMPDGGTLTLEISQVADRVCLAVKDTGTGIARENLSHIFDPYFTTKAKGTGIGLPTVHKIVEAFHGEISVESKQATDKHAGGTTFRMWLPAVEAAPGGSGGEDGTGTADDTAAGGRA